jgi:hypothetical protein
VSQGFIAISPSTMMNGDARHSRSQPRIRGYSDYCQLSLSYGNL